MSGTYISSAAVLEMDYEPPRCTPLARISWPREEVTEPRRLGRSGEQGLGTLRRKGLWQEMWEQRKARGRLDKGGGQRALWALSNGVVQGVRGREG